MRVELYEEIEYLSLTVVLFLHFGRFFFPLFDVLRHFVFPLFSLRLFYFRFVFFHFFFRHFRAVLRMHPSLFCLDDLIIIIIFFLFIIFIIIIVSFIF